MRYFPTWKIWIVVLVSVLGLAFAAPNLLSRDLARDLPTWLPHKQVSLGLDLSGGAHLLLQIDEAAWREGRLAWLEGNVRRTLRGERIGVRVIGGDDDHRQFALRNADDADAAARELDGLADDFTITVDETGTIIAAFTEEGLEAGLGDAIERTLEVLRGRIDPDGVLEPVITRQGRDRILVQVPGVDDTRVLRSRLGQTAKLTFHLVDQDTSIAAAEAGQLPVGSVLMPGREQPGQNHVLRAEILVTGESLESAAASFDQGRPVVAFSFDGVGAARFCDVTTENVGRLLAIVLDGVVISAPRINGPICQGSGIITGSFTVFETQELALLLRGRCTSRSSHRGRGERTVGPTLGADSIEAGKVAAVVSFAAVIVFMIACYGTLGAFANVALITNLILLMGLLSLLQATLTLPGIAGIVLTVGMAVDANVLIFERIREELRHGRTILNAVETGFRRAMTTILDANITTAVAAFLLFFLGSGPVRGFGATLAIGILTSMFTAMLLTRLLTHLWLARFRPKALGI